MTILMFLFAGIGVLCMLGLLGIAVWMYLTPLTDDQLYTVRRCKKCGHEEYEHL